MLSYWLAYGLHKRINEMAKDPKWNNGYVEFCLAKHTKFWYPNALACLNYLVRQKSYASNMVWAPVRDYNRAEEKVYTGMNTKT